MKEQEKILQAIEQYILTALTLIKKLTPENFESNFSEAYNNVKKAKELRDDVRLIDLDPKLDNHIKKVNETTKLLEKEYDNILEKYFSEINLIGNAIKSVNNKRKLASYSGGMP